MLSVGGSAGVGRDPNRTQNCYPLDTNRVAPLPVPILIVRLFFTTSHIPGNQNALHKQMATMIDHDDIVDSYFTRPVCVRV